jgi:hypothetical protein
MPNHIVHTPIGARYALLTVLRFSHTGHGGAYYIAQCLCGVICTVRGSSMRRGAVKSCGCLRRATARARAPIAGRAYAALRRAASEMKRRQPD